MGDSAQSGAQFPKETGKKGEFVRQDSAFRQWVKADGSTDFAPAAGHYHLYISWACPWAHRTAIVRKLKGLEDAISMSAVDPIRDDKGWRFTEGRGHGPDPINGFSFLSEAYRATDDSFDGRVTVPVLWDKEAKRIVNNESAELIVMLDQEFGEYAQNQIDLYPADKRGEIDAINKTVYDNVNNGVYRSGFASTQEAYEEAVAPLFETLDKLDQRLATQRWLVQHPHPTLADWRLFTTLVRFDAVYVGHFKCNLRRIADFPHLGGYLRDLYQQPGVSDTVDMDHIKRHYYVTHGNINPTRVVPKGPLLDLDADPGRSGLD